MKIDSLDIRDVGIFQGEKIENLGDGIVVIGGLNRAGKSTFMEVVRHLPYGFNKNENIPEPKFDYDVRTTLISDDGYKYNVLLNKNNAPVVTTQDGNPIREINELFNDLDKYTYKELFTISLDEIGKLKDKDNNRLNSVLLGAGLKDITKLPPLIRELKKEADRIGGKKGNVSVKQFKPHYDIINNGNELHKKAENEVKEYNDKSINIEKVKGAIQEKQIELGLLNNKIVVLDLLINNYKTYYDMLQFKNEYEKNNLEKEYTKEDIIMAKQFHDNYMDVIDQYKQKQYKYIINVSNDLNLKDKYVKYKKEIVRCNNELSGLKEKYENLKDYKKNIKNKAYDILNRMKSINTEWNNLDDIKDMQCDVLKIDKVKDVIDERKELIKDKQSIKEEINTLETNKGILNQQFKNLKMQKPYFYMKLYFVINIIFAFLGVILFNVKEFLGITFFIIGLIGSIILIISKYSIYKDKLSNHKKVNDEIIILDQKIKSKNKQINNINEQIQKSNNEIMKYRKEIKVGEKCSEDEILIYYRYILDFKKSIEDMLNENKIINEKEKEFSLMLRQFNELIGKFIDINEDEEMFSSNQDLFMKIEELSKNLIYAEKFDEIEFKKKDIEESIEQFLNQDNIDDYKSRLTKYISEGKTYLELLSLKEKYNKNKDLIIGVINSGRVRPSIKSVLEKEHNHSEEDLFLAIEYLYNKYLSEDEIISDYENAKRLKENIENEIHKSNEECQKLKYDVEKLSSDKTIERAHKLIVKGRDGLYPLARKYAVYNTASFILGEMQKRFIDAAKNTVLKDSSDILNKVTQGEIANIELMDNLNICDFKTISKNGDIYNSSDMLSRGTIEQLFLSVRISRIKDIQPLPVIFDDSFVNFDINHIKSVVDILKDLSERNQIFVLTCHSKLVDIISKTCDNVQYVKLEKGKFSHSSDKELINYLG